MVVLSTQYGQSEKAKKVIKNENKTYPLYTIFLLSFPSFPPFHNSLIQSKSKQNKKHKPHGQLAFFTSL